MEFTIERRALEKLLKAIASGPGEPDRIGATVVLSACAGRVCVQCKGDVASIQGNRLRGRRGHFARAEIRTLLKTYKGTRSLTFEASAVGLRVQTFWMPVLGYELHPKPPAE